MNVDLGTDAPTDPAQKRSVDDIIQQLSEAGRASSDTTITDGVKTINVTREESKAAKDIVEKLLEIKTANEIGAKQLRMTSKGYANAKRKSAEIVVEKLKIERDISQNGENPQNLLSKQQKEEELRRANVKENLVGPVYDLNNLVKNKMGRR